MIVPFIGLLGVFGLIPAGSIHIQVSPVIFVVSAKLIELIGIISLLIYQILGWKKYYYPRDKYIAILVAVLIPLHVFSIFATIYPILKPIDYPPLGYLRSAGWFLLVYMIVFYKPRRDKKWTELTIDELVYGYVMGSINLNKDLSSPDDKSAEVDRTNGFIWTTFTELRSRDPELKAMRKLLKHKDDCVRVMAARQLIWLLPEESLKILDDEGRKKGRLADAARLWADEWRNKKLPTDRSVLHFPYEQSIAK